MKHCCEKCGSWENVEKHHTFPGPLRRISEKYGATHYLCNRCHQDPRQGVQHNREEALALKMADQHRIMVERGWTLTEWLIVFGKSYLDADELAEIADEIAGGVPEGSFTELDPIPLFI